jgi:hypothetical protein
MARRSDGQRLPDTLDIPQYIVGDLCDPPLIPFAVLDHGHRVSLLLFENAQGEGSTLRPVEVFAQEQHQEGIVVQPAFGAAIYGRQDRPHSNGLMT